MGVLSLFRRAGGFAWLMVAMLALGVGAATAFFSVVNGVLLRPLPFHDPGQLVLVGERVPEVAFGRDMHWFVNPAAFLAWRREATSFAALAAIGPSTFALAGSGAPAPRLLHGAHVSSNFFDLLEVHAQLGRLLRPQDEKDASRPMVITDALWRSAFNADPGVLGRTLGTGIAAGGDAPHARVVGVLPAWFQLQGRELGPMFAGQPAEYFDAVNNMRANAPVFTDFNYSVIGRLRAGVSPEQALAQLNLIQANLARTAPEKLALYAEIVPVRDYAVAAARSELWLLLGGVAAVLLIVCVNLGGLWLTRLADRRRDWAIRAALGASPSRLARRLLFESVGLAIAGGLLGIALAALSLRTLLALAPANLPRLNEVHLDWRVLLFGLLLSLVAGLLTGVLPALRLSRLDPQLSLKASGSSTTADRASLASRQALIAVQAALATLLLAAVGLLGLSFYRLAALPTGFSAAHALTADIVLNAYSDDAQRTQLMGRLPAALAAVPGVQAAAFTSQLPLQGETWIDLIGVPGRVYPPGHEPPTNVRFVSPGYFTTIGIPLLAGRDLAESDMPRGWPPKTEAAEAAMPESVVISRATAQMLWPGDNLRAIVGRKIQFNGQVTPTVVGIAADAHDATLTAAPPSVVYQPYWEQPPYQVAMVLRTALPPAALAAPLRAAIASLAPAAPVSPLRPLDSLKAQALAPQRYQLSLLLLFAAAALLLAALGVYALVAHSVARRAKELAIRITMGARAGDLWSLVLRQALAPVGAGVLAGLLLALAGGRLLAAQLFEVRPSSPGVLAAVALAVLAAAFAACLLPARRATRTDPLAALRAE
ncbi:MAG: ADOP family duplicated permease [Terriglobales bacterium]